MKILIYTIPKQSLKDIPRKERDFFLLAGHFANELIFFSKLVTITEKRSSEKISEKAELTQFLIVLKTLAGKLHEGWQMIHKYYFGTAISKIYCDDLADDAQEAIKQLKRYFSNKNFINKVRNSYSFHYDPDEINSAIEEMENEGEFEMYIADQHINSLYYASESVVNKAMLHELGPNDLQSNFDKLHDDIVLVHEQLLTFINSFMTVATGRYFVKTSSNPICEEIKIDDLPNLKDLRFPFFVNTSSQSTDT